MYEIKSNSDFKNGATLIIKIPMDELDKNAFNTILVDKPDFLLSFTYKIFDNEIEITYYIGKLTKLIYFSSNYSVFEYKRLWNSLLQPLIDCEDWFMTPYSFVLKLEHLYFNRENKSISFIYIPSIKPYSNFEMLKAMVTDVAKQNRVDDINLENKVIWAITDDFNPREFLDMLKIYSGGEKQNIKVENNIKDNQVDNENKPKEDKKNDGNNFIENVADVGKNNRSNDGIFINFPNKTPKNHGSIFDKLKGKNKDNKNEKQISHNNKKTKQKHEIMKGAVEDLQRVNYESEALNIPNINNNNDNNDMAEMTKIDVRLSNFVGFQYVGNGSHPKLIEVTFNNSNIFTIGRFDIRLGVKQSSFEFHEKTKAVSRRHAAVEKTNDGFTIVDIGSSAGTYINGQKIPPNIPYKLYSGDCVKFGNAGADYVWEE